MKNTLIALSLAFLLQNAFADTKTQVPTDLKHVSISLEATACYGTCPIFNVTILGDGTVKYHGEAYVKTSGDKTYHIPVAEVKKLVHQFYQSNFFSLNDRYAVNVTDLPSVITSITNGSTTKKVLCYGTCPESVTELKKSILKTAKIDEKI